jgi:hypothetical protein
LPLFNQLRQFLYFFFFLKSCNINKSLPTLAPILKKNHLISPYGHQTIQELVKLINKTNIGEITIEEEGVKNNSKQEERPRTAYHFRWTAAQTYSTSVRLPPQNIPGSTSPSSPVVEAPKQITYITIKSPMIGTFYRQSGPGKPFW